VISTLKIKTPVKLHFSGAVNQTALFSFRKSFLIPYQLFIPNIRSFIFRLKREVFTDDIFLKDFPKYFK